jgi:hypothetical protein
VDEGAAPLEWGGEEGMGRLTSGYEVPISLVQDESDSGLLCKGEEGSD